MVVVADVAVMKVAVALATAVLTAVMMLIVVMAKASLHWWLF